MNSEFMPLIAFLSVGTVITQIIVVIGFVLYLLSLHASSKSYIHKIASFLGKNSVAFGLIIAVFASLSTLFLSEIAGLLPCELCWYQRICMFPQIVVLGVAYFVHDAKAKITSLALSVIGLIIASYHILLQIYPAYFPCSDRAANCAVEQFKFFGYVTIPVMSATVFSLLILLMLFGLRKK